MKIVVADALPVSALALIQSVQGWTVDAKFGRTPEVLAQDLRDADALIVRSATTVDRPLLASSPRLRVVARAGTGVDNVDVEAATERGVLVVNTPGANSISVAEHAFALILALARTIPAADRAMKDRRWEKKSLVGRELRGKTLGVVGLGRIGQEVALRARAFGMRVVAHDPFIASTVAGTIGVDLLSLDQLCAESDYITLHLPSSPSTARLFDDRRFAGCRRGVRLVNTARGELVDEAALKRALDAGIVAGAALDVFASEPPDDWSLASLPQVIATPHIAASTEEAQELVGLETAAAVRDFLREGTVRNAVNIPSLPPGEWDRLRPWIRLADRLGAIASQLQTGRIHRISVRLGGELAEQPGSGVLAASVASGALRPALTTGVSIVNARSIADSRGIEVVESRSSRPGAYTSLIGVQIESDEEARRVEGTVFEGDSLRIVSVDGVPVEAPLAGALVIVQNDDRPGVIGEVGSILGRRGINIASFALGRRNRSATGIVVIDDAQAGDAALEAAVGEIRTAAAVRSAWLVRG